MSIWRDVDSVFLNLDGLGNVIKVVGAPEATLEE